VVRLSPINRLGRVRPGDLERKIYGCRICLTGEEAQRAANTFTNEKGYTNSEIVFDGFTWQPDADPWWSYPHRVAALRARWQHSSLALSGLVVRPRDRSAEGSKPACTSKQPTFAWSRVGHCQHVTSPSADLNLSALLLPQPLEDHVGKRDAIKQAASGVCDENLVRPVFTAD
jgi:hypothetical protein